ncbi:PfkB family carbohydrate kinase [Aliiroseovarius sp.]|uniref:PfkB family carbohydrate kinase n=1 Tax=Aliiroseovarius sp. TaxID=1872442 RepID=UPI003BAD5668
MNRVLCIGAAVVDFVFHLPSLPGKPQKYGTEEAEIVGGGCAANAAVAIARLGGEAVLGARLGEDPIGDMILADLVAEGVDVGNVTRTPGARSSYSSVFIDAEGERQIVNFRGAGLVLDTGWFEAQQDLGAVLTDTRRVDAALAALNLAKARGISGVLDGEAPVDPRLMTAASHVALSMQGLQSLYPDLSIEAALACIRTEHDAWACVTDGPNGVWFTTKIGVSHIPAHDICPVDTLAAGDVWHGAFAVALAEGKDELSAIRTANAAAALKCMTKGGRAGAPTRAQLQDFLKETTP